MYPYKPAGQCLESFNHQNMINWHWGEACWLISVNPVIWLANTCISSVQQIPCLFSYVLDSISGVFFCMSLIPVMPQNIYIMGCYILIHLSRIMLTHGTLKLQTIQIRKAADMAGINVFNHKSSRTIPNEMVCWRNWLIGISINSNRPQILVFKIKKGFKWNWSLHLSGYLCLYQQAFESMKALSVADTALMCYPDHNFLVHFLLMFLIFN